MSNSDEHMGGDSPAGLPRVSEEELCPQSLATELGVSACSGTLSCWDGQWHNNNHQLESLCSLQVLIPADGGMCSWMCRGC